uniref:Putative protease inhibitor n=1 Tax=Superstitionia donensis TaxID=311983 RepID=A0A1V1WBJ5_9SCOR
MKRNTILGVFALIVLFSILDKCEAEDLFEELSCKNPDEVFSQCFPICPLTCDDYVNPKPMCGLTDTCLFGCVCRRGYAFQNEIHSRCIPISDCKSG